MKNCLLIGITGGIGAGKSVAINYLKENYNCEVIVADNLANEIKLKGHSCYQPLVNLLGNDVLGDDDEIDKAKMAAKLFASPELTSQINAIIHPAVRIEIENIYKKCCDEQKVKYVFLEAALLIECGYENILDELWYIRADVSSRTERLKSQRGYKEDRIQNTMSHQLSDDEFSKHATKIINNNGIIESFYAALDDAISSITF